MDQERACPRLGVPYRIMDDGTNTAGAAGTRSLVALPPDDN